MNTLVSHKNLHEVLTKLNETSLLVFDCETTGLKPYHGASMFSLALSDGIDNYYFNFKPYPKLDPSFILAPHDLDGLFYKSKTWVAHNAKFDLHFTDKGGIKPWGEIVDTEVLAVLYNNNFKYKGGYSLDSCVRRWLSLEKDDRVKQWMDENKAFTTHFNFEGRAEKHYFFDQVPFELISEYAMKDAEITYKLYRFLMENLYPNKALETEVKLTPILFEMEKVGILIDLEYCNKAYDFETEKAKKAVDILAILCGGEFTDSAKFLAPLLKQRGFVLPSTELGNEQVTDEVMEQFPGDPLARAVLAYRTSMKRAQTYFANYRGSCDQHNSIHPNFRQAGTVTGRTSCNQPNLQNLPSEDDGDFPIRRAFVPRPGFLFVSIDYAQMEFRLMLEYANERELIEKIKNGHDPHDATAELTGLSRKPAKTLNFGLLYGMGIAKLAKAIGVSEAEAKQFKWDYFRALPGVKRFIRAASDAQSSRGFTFNWTGRRYYIDDPRWAYKAANSIIQGGCADICKLAMVKLQDLLLQLRSRMLLQIHDEILFEVHHSELFLIPQLFDVMAQAYEAKNMPLTCSVSYSFNNFHDLIEVDINEAQDVIGKELSAHSSSGT